jgi:hypothetical protein
MVPSQNMHDSIYANGRSNKNLLQGGKYSPFFKYQSTAMPTAKCLLENMKFLLNIFGHPPTDNSGF